MARTGRPVPFVPRRIHIAAMGFEVDRVAEPIIDMRGEVAVLFANTAAEDLAASFRARVLARLKAARIETQVIRAPIFDLYSTTQSMLAVLRARRRDRLYVNVSSGSKVQALSGYIATSLAKSEGIPVESYYAEPEGYARTEGEPLSHGFRRAFTLPTLTVRCPSPALRAAMGALEAGPLTKVQLAIRLAQVGVLDAGKLNSEERPRDDASRVSLLTSLDVRVLRPLAEWGFTVSTRVGRNVRVSLTEEGQLGLRLYRIEG